jgi:hypothetical protein
MVSWHVGANQQVSKTSVPMGGIADSGNQQGMQSHICVGEISMKLLKGWKLRILTGLALASIGGQLQAQMKPGSMDPSLLGAGQGPMAPASYRIPGPAPGMEMSPEMDPSMGMPMGMDPSMPYAGCGPEGYGAECNPGCNGACGGGHCGPGMIGCTDLFGRDRCGLFGAIGSKLGSCCGILRPYGEGGIASQRWFDLYAEAIFLKRTKGAANFNTSSLGAGSNNFVLGTDQVDLNDLEAGLSLQANIQTGPGSNLEVVYFGLNNWQESASANATANPPNLFSFMSAFGTVPANGFDDTDRSVEHLLDYSSELHNGEVNFRRRWSEPYGFFQGSFLAGIRYLDLDEQSRFRARGEFDNTFAFNSLRYFDYTVNTQNSLVGFQVGADLWYNIFPGIKLGMEGKTGVYNNRAHQNTFMFGNSIPAYSEEVLSNSSAYITQLSSQLIYRLNYSWAVRTSYQLLYIDGVALAAENFNGAQPAIFAQNTVRTPTINRDAEILLQGFTIGAEYMW